MATLNWTDQATEDIISIGEFIAKDSVRFAKITVKRIRENSRRLKKFPKIGRMVPEVNNQKIKELIFGNYRIIYHLKTENRVDILTVHHMARSLDIDFIINQTK